MSLVYGTTHNKNENDIVEAVEINNDTNLKDTVINGCCDFYRYIKHNWKDLLYFSGFILMILGYFTMIFIFYIFGTVYPEKWTFMATNTAKGFYIFFIIVSIFIHSTFWIYVINNHNIKVNLLIWFTLTGIFCLIPFLTADILIKERYNNLCDDYLYTIEIHKNSLEYFLDDILILKSSYSYNTQGILNIKTSTLIGTNYTFHIQLNNGFSNGFDVEYNKKLKIFNSQSTSTAWYNNPMKLTGDINILTGQNPFDKNQCKLCINNYDKQLVQSALIFPLQQRMKTCRQCMEPCQNECTLWLTRTIPYTSCDSKGKCHTSYRTETYCGRYRSYSECLNTRCRYPACVGIRM